MQSASTQVKSTDYMSNEPSTVTPPASVYNNTRPTGAGGNQDKAVA